ncbi:hypothetical protein BU17DRAFT_42447, partial [Hysterangium stoloniferum]
STTWSLYLNETEKEGKELANSSQVGVDELLIYVFFQAGLFRVSLTAFLIESRKDLQIDPVQEILQVIPNHFTVITSQAFEVSKSSLIVNYSWFTSLGLTLFSALCAVLAREWLAKYIHVSPETRSSDACQRLLRVKRAQQWRLESVVTGIPLLIQLAFFLFSAGLVLFTWNISVTLGVLMLFLTIFAIVLYILGTVFPLLSPPCLFQTTASRFFPVVSARAKYDASTSDYCGSLPPTRTYTFRISEWLESLSQFFADLHGKPHGPNLKLMSWYG